MERRSFLSSLVTIVFIVLGIVAIISIPLYVNSFGIASKIAMGVLIVYAALYFVAGYGLSKGARFGWMLATSLILLNLIGTVFMWINGYQAVYLSLFINSILFLLLLAIHKEYGISIGRYGRPTTPVPPPSAPVSAVASVEPIERRNIYVKRKHDY